MTPSCHDYAFIVKHENEATQLLVQSTPDGDTLLHTLNDTHFWQTVAPVNQAIHEKYNFQISTLCCLKTDYQQDIGVINSYAMQYHKGDLPDNARWIASDELNLSTELLITNEEAKQWLNWLASDDNRPQWFKLDWYTKISDIAISHNATSEQIRSWERSTVWRLASPNGDTYLKAIPPMFAHEVPLSVWLNEKFPYITPKVLASPQNNMLLFADYGNLSLMEKQDLRIWREALQTYAQLQVDILPFLEEITTLAVPIRSLDWIVERIETFLSEEANLIRGTMPLSPDEIASIRKALPQLLEACDHLKNVGIPLTLEHGDLWAGQIIVQSDNYLITDWSDSAITFPLFSLPFFLAELENDLPDIPQATQVLTDAYLQTWSGYTSLEELQQLMPHVQKISPLYSALRYHYDILPQMNQKWEMENMVAYNLRLLLKELNVND